MGHHDGSDLGSDHSVLDHLASQLGENWGQDQPTGGIQWMRKGDLQCDSFASEFYA